jgi:hypothetical protein
VARRGVSAQHVERVLVRELVAEGEVRGVHVRPLHREQREEALLGRVPSELGVRRWVGQRREQLAVGAQAEPFAQEAACGARGACDDAVGLMVRRGQRGLPPAILGSTTRCGTLSGVVGRVGTRCLGGATACVGAACRKTRALKNGARIERRVQAAV